MTRKPLLLAMLSALFGPALAGAALAAEPAAPPSFTRKPTATKAGELVKIEFAVDRETDVEVAILGAKGEVVRHLVAGVLGKNPPEPLKANSLEQTVEWDGRDDAGKPAAGGPFQARVRAGLKPEPDGFLLENPASTGPVHSLAIGPKGALYVFHSDATTGAGHWGSTKIKVLTRDGKHQQAIMPFPADLAPEKVKPLGVFQTEQGDLVPRIHHLLRLSFYPDPVWRSPAQCPAVDSRGRVHWLVLGPALASLDPDGGVPYESLVGPKLLPDRKDLNMANMWFYGQSRPGLALSTDEKFLYFAGLTTGDPKKKEPAKGVPCVFRVPLEKRDPAEVFLGKLDTPGTEKELLTAPRGLAVAKGLVYVADHDADRVAVFNENDRSPAGEIKVKAPDTLGVDPADGAVYVCSLADPKTPDLIKFENYQTGKERYRLPLPTYKYANEGARPHRIAVDASAKPVRIYLPTIPYSNSPPLLAIEDAGDKFVIKGDPRSPEPWAEGPRDLSYDRIRDELYVKVNYQRWYRLDGKTGKVQAELKPPISYRPEAGSQLVPDPEGNLVTYSWSKDFGLRRFTRDGKPLNWPGLTTNYFAVSGLMCYQVRHLLVPRTDEMYLIPPSGWKDGSSTPTQADEPTGCLNVFGADGKPKKTLIWQCMKGAIPRLDAKGNLYLADMVKPPDRSFPEFFDGKLKAPPKQTNNQNDSYYYSYMYGSIIKFPPTGGAIWYGAKGLPASVEGQPPAELLARPKVPIRIHAGFSTQEKGELQGALWYRFGFAPYTCTMSSCMLTCMCEGGGFDVDPCGRVFFPNLGQFRVEVLDTNGNPITTFGKYGNQDSGGKDARVKQPDIPLAWPLTVAVSDTHAYVADTLNRRVVKVRLGYAVEAACEVK